MSYISLREAIQKSRFHILKVGIFPSNHRLQLDEYDYLRGVVVEFCVKPRVVFAFVCTAIKVTSTVEIHVIPGGWWNGSVLVSITEKCGRPTMVPEHSDVQGLLARPIQDIRITAEIQHSTLMARNYVQYIGKWYLFCSDIITIIKYYSTLILLGIFTLASNAMESILVKNRFLQLRAVH